MVVLLLGLLRSAIRDTLPPLPVLLAAAFALRLPVWLIELLASSTMRPPSCRTPLASMLPLLMTLPASWLAARADKMTCPSGAWMAWRFSTKVAS